MAKSASQSGTTIKDVAKIAGVSAMTVSRVVNGASNVKSSTRERVMTAIRDLSYRPNLAARTLTTRRTVRVGFLYASPNASFLSEFLLGLLKRAEVGDVQLLVESCEDGRDMVHKALGRLTRAGIQGIVLPPPLSDSAVLTAELQRLGIVAATVAAGRAAVDMISVHVDERRAMYEMTQKVLRLGHVRLGYVPGPDWHISTRERREGFDTAIRGLEHVSVSVATGSYTFESGQRAGEELLDVEPRPTVILATNDDMAAGVIAAANRRGVAMPEDLSVVGYDDTAVATYTSPPLTTVRQPIREMAFKALDVLCQHIGAKDGAEESRPEQVAFPFTLVDRGTLAAPRGRLLDDKTKRAARGGSRG